MTVVPHALVLPDMPNGTIEWVFWQTSPATEPGHGLFSSARLSDKPAQSRSLTVISNEHSSGTFGRIWNDNNEFRCAVLSNYAARFTNFICSGGSSLTAGDFDINATARYNFDVTTNRSSSLTAPIAFADILIDCAQIVKAHGSSVYLTFAQSVFGFASTARAFGLLASPSRTELILSESTEALNALSALPDNWNGAGGKSVRTDTITASKDLVRQLAPYVDETPFFYPAPEGGVVIEIGSGGERLTIILEDDFLLGVSFLRGVHESEEFTTTGGAPSAAVSWLTSRLNALRARR